MPRPLWSGALSFGMVTIPVTLHNAVHEHAIHFHQISRSGHRRIHYRKVIADSDETVPDADIVKGYEVRKGHYVVFTDDELKQLAAGRSSLIEISAFVHLGDIDPRYFDQLYYLLPGEHGAKPYQLLLEAMAAQDRVGLARLVLHGREHVIVVRSFEAALGVQTLRYRDEIIEPESLLPTPRVAVTAKELALASQLITSMGGRFAPATYRDEYRIRLQAAIDRKAKGQTLAVAPEREAMASDEKVIDLMSALTRSLRSRTKGRSASHAHAAALPPADEQEGRPSAKEAAKEPPKETAKDGRTRAAHHPLRHRHNHRPHAS